MRSSNYIIYIPGAGDVPEERENLPTLWKPYGLETEIQRIDWTNTDYEQRLETIGNRIVQLFEQGERVSVAGDSGGAKPALSLFAKHADYLHRAVTISGKIDPYNLNPAARGKFPNLVISSDNFPDDLKTLRTEMLERILCVHPLADKVVAPEDAVLEGAHEHIVDAHDHVEGIRRALTQEANIITDFVQQD